MLCLPFVLLAIVAVLVTVALVWVMSKLDEGVAAGFVAAFIESFWESANDHH